MSADLDTIVEKILPDVAFMTLDQPDIPMSQAVRMCLVSHFPDEREDEGIVGQIAHFFEMSVHGRKAIKDARKELIGEAGIHEFLPDEVEIARNLYNIGKTAPEMKDRVAAMKEYSELLRFKDREQDADEGPPVRHVMKVIMTGDGSAEAWEQKATEQQDRVQREAQESEKARAGA